MKKTLSILLCFVMIAILCFSLVACKNTNDDEPQEFVLEEDAYDMANTGTTIGQKILDTALSGIGSGVSAGVSKVVSSVGSWAVEGIIKSLGFEYYGEEAYKKEVLDRLEDINISIAKLEGKVDWLTKTFNDQKYYDKYMSFNSAYKALSNSIYTPYEFLTIVEKNIQENTEKDINADLDEICKAIQGNTGTGKAQMQIDLENFADNYFISSTSSSVTELQELSIFKIADKYVKEYTAYAENRYKQVQELVSYPYSTFYVGVSLVILDYTRTMEQNGITQYWLDNQGNVIGYEVKELVEDTEKSTTPQYTYTAYWNCTDLEKDKYVEKYGELVKDTPLKDAKAKTINNINSQLQSVCLNLSQMLSKYYKVNELYNSFMKNYTSSNQEGKLHLKADDNKTVLQTASSTFRTVWAKDIISVSSIDGSTPIGINYSNFGNITKAQFESYVNTIAKNAYTVNADGTKTNLTFRQFFEKEGFSFPTNNSSSYLILGAEAGFADYDDYWNNGIWYKNCIAVVCIDLNTVIADFVKKPTYARVYYTYSASKNYKNSSCGPKYDTEWSLVEGTGSQGKGFGSTINFATKDPVNFKLQYKYRLITYYTLDGLSSSPKTGVSTSLSF